MVVSEERETTMTGAMTLRGQVADYFGLERNVVAVSIATFLMAFGEDLWKRFVPKYLV